MISPISDFADTRRAPRVVPPLHADVAGWLAGDPRWVEARICSRCHVAHYGHAGCCDRCRAWHAARFQARRREKS